VRRLDIIAGTRPNFVKIAGVLRELKVANDAAKSFTTRLVHTGQHYDMKMSGHFFEDLEIPEPCVNFNVGSGSHAKQTAQVMIAYEELIQMKKPDLCMVFGDVNSTLGCAIASQKSGVPVAHIEAGLRSNDWSMPEEINRIATDAISNFFFTTTSGATENLLREGKNRENIFTVGNTVIDTLLFNLGRLRKPSVWHDFDLVDKQFFVLTLHRVANVDNQESLLGILDAVIKSCGTAKIIFPVHPRVKKTLAKIALPSNLLVVDAMRYLEFNYLVKHAAAAITDSGGVTEETTVMGVPCLTLRDSTERPETVIQGTNYLVGSNLGALTELVKIIQNNEWKTGEIPPMWDGKASSRIVSVLGQIL
jgi:UDP-N-acetylglucosamine 2-epimerase (non-hydrolysing)